MEKRAGKIKGEHGFSGAELLTFFTPCSILAEVNSRKGVAQVPCGRKRKLQKIATHKRKKKLRKNRHKNK
jgi:hypothetical protein